MLTSKPLYRGSYKYLRYWEYETRIDPARASSALCMDDDGKHHCAWLHQPAGEGVDQ